MEDKLKYYYNLKDIEIIKNDDNYLIFDKDNNLYYLYKIDRDIKNINKYYKYHEVIYNINNEYIFNLDNYKYILFKVNSIVNEEVTLDNIINNNILNRKVENQINDVINLWSKRLDYLEYQISQFAIDKEEILNSFSFFIGLGENAINFININNINYNNLTKSLTHKRMHPSIINLEYYNPINVLIDYEVRDYAEYIKYKILKDDNTFKDVKYILDNAKLSDDDIKLFYARLMFPTLYFDTLESILLDNKKESELNIFIETLPRYLNLLKDTYLEIKKSISIDIPSWIIKS